MDPLSTEKEDPSASTFPQEWHSVCTFKSFHMLEKHLAPACCLNMAVIERESLFCSIQRDLHVINLLGKNASRDIT